MIKEFPLDIETLLINKVWYDKHSGRLTSRQDSKVVDKKKFKSFRSFTFKGKRIQSHRIAWFLHYGYWPLRKLKHINGNKGDNSIGNLQYASAGNTERKHIGILWLHQEQTWVVKMFIDDMSYQICQEENMVNAVQSRRSAELIYMDYIRG